MWGTDITDYRVLIYRSSLYIFFFVLVSSHGCSLNRLFLVNLYGERGWGIGVGPEIEQFCTST